MPVLSLGGAMRRRDKAGGRAAKPQRPKTLKRRNGLKTKETNIAQFIRERDEAREQQTATAEILRVIRTTPTDTQPVFEAIVQSGLKLFPDAAILIVLPDGDKLRAAAFADTDPARAKALLRVWPVPLTREYNHAIAILDRRMIDIPEARDAPSELAAGAQYFLTTGYRAITIMPMMRGGDAIGALSVVRAAPGALSDKQIAVLRTFADQAVIAIENTRLLNELRESLQQQTATADVLKVISRSTFDLQAVLDTLTESACRLCDADASILWRPNDDVYMVASNFGQSASHQQAMRQLSIRPGRETCVGRVLVERRTVHIPDCEADPEYKVPDVLRVAGNRAILGVPLVREGLPIGVLALTRSTARPFTEKQIELVKTFADQAVIAIENVRLFEAEQQRTRELSESLEQQTATSEVLKVISSSPGQLEPVFQAMLENATRVCEADCGVLFRLDSDVFRAAAMVGLPSVYADDLQHKPRRVDAQTGLGRLARTRETVHITDLKAERYYAEGNSQAVAAVDLGGIRTYLGVPLLKENELIGAILLYCKEVRPFTDKQIELVQNFAAQAVIAIENTRLLNELRQRTGDLSEALEQQRASAEVLNVISNSVSDAEPVFEKIVESCERIFATSRIGLNLIGPDGLVHAGAYGKFPGAEKLRRENFPHPVPGSATEAAISAGRPIQYPDALSDSDVPQYGRRAAKIVGFRAFVMAPLLSEGRGLGAIFVGRETIGSFSDKEIALLKTFAAQAVIAIENTRLLNELREIAAAADRDRRRAQGDQPLGLRPAECARYAGRVGGAPV